MGATLTVNETSTQMVRLVGDKLVQEEAQRNLYVVPPKGEYEFMVTGYALPFQMKKDPQYITKDSPSETQTMTRLECTVIKGGGKGKMFTVMLGFSIGPKSNLGKLLRGFAVDLTPKVGADGKPGWDLDRAIGYVGKATIIPSDTLDDEGKPKYARLSQDMGFTPVSAPERAYSITIDETASAPAASNGHTNGAQAPESDGWE